LNRGVGMPTDVEDLVQIYLEDYYNMKTDKEMLKSKR
jgi:hypothetical protein